MSNAYIFYLKTATSGTIINITKFAPNVAGLFMAEREAESVFSNTTMELIIYIYKIHR